MARLKGTKNNLLVNNFKWLGVKNMSTESYTCDQVITAKCMKFPSIYWSYSIEHYCISSRLVDHQSTVQNPLKCEWLCTEPFTGTMIQWMSERATSEFTATTHNNMNVMYMEWR